jgi:hypothetical protein
MGPGHTIERNKQPGQFWFFIGLRILLALFMLVAAWAFASGKMSEK